jgi:hypothetical protein
MAKKEGPRSMSETLPADGWGEVGEGSPAGYRGDPQGAILVEATRKLLA